MEKRRLCDRRLFSFGFVSLLFGLLAATPLRSAEVREAVVEVEVPVEAGNVAGAVQAAQVLAFEKAVMETLPSGLTEAQKEARIKNAANYIKSFRILSQSERSGRLFSKISCEVIILAGELSSENEDQSFRESFALEFLWKSDQPILATELKDWIESEFKGDVRTMKLQKGSLWMEIRTPIQPERVYAGLQSRFRSRADIRLIKDLYGIYSQESLGQDLRERSEP